MIIPGEVAGTQNGTAEILKKPGRRLKKLKRAKQILK